MAIRSRRSRLAGVIAACALILAAPAGFLASGTTELRAWIDANWKPRATSVDRRWLALGGVTAVFALGGAVLLLARGRRRRTALTRELASASGRAAANDGEHAQLVARWDAWIADRHAHGVGADLSRRGQRVLVQAPACAQR